MALTASMYVFPTYLTSSQTANVVCTIKNTGTSDVTVAGLQSVVTQGQSNQARQVALPIGRSAVVPAGGQLSIPWSDGLGCGIQSVSPEFRFTVGALITYSNSATITVAEAATVNVVAQQDSSPVQPGTQPYTPTPGPLASVTAGAVQPGAYPNPPVAGQVRLDSSLNDVLVVVIGL